MQVKTPKRMFCPVAHPPFQLVVGPRGEGGALDDLAHLLATEAEVVDGPHVRKLHHLDLGKVIRCVGTSVSRF